MNKKQNRESHPNSSSRGDGRNSGSQLRARCKLKQSAACPGKPIIQRLAAFRNERGGGEEKRDQKKKSSRTAAPPPGTARNKVGLLPFAPFFHLVTLDSNTYGSATTNLSAKAPRKRESPNVKLSEPDDAGRAGIPRPQSPPYTIEPRYHEHRYNETCDITNDFQNPQRKRVKLSHDPI